MSNVTVQETAQTEETQLKRRRLFAQRTDRKGALGSTELLQLLAVVAIIALLGGGVLLLINALKSSGEHSVVKGNIAKVSTMADTYWNSYAADVDGRRKINLGDFCEYANNQLVGEELNLRTLQLADGATGATTLVAAPAAADSLARGIAALPNTGATATCAHRDGGLLADTWTQNEAYADIVAYGANNPITTGLHTAHGTGVLPTTAARTYTGSAPSASAEVRTAALDAIGLRSTKTVWMALYGTGVALTAGFAPDGTDTVYATTANASTTERGVEYLVFGGMAPDGTSFCMIKVFDASDKDAIGEYRGARLTTDNDEFATCAAGLAGTGDDGLVQGTWPEPR